MYCLFYIMNRPYEDYLVQCKEGIRIFEYYVKKIIKKYSKSDGEIENVTSVIKRIFVLRYFLMVDTTINNINSVHWQLNSLMYSILNISNDHDETFKYKYVDTITGITKGLCMFNYWRASQMIPSIDEYESFLFDKFFIEFVCWIIYEQLPILTETDKTDICKFMEAIAKYIKLCDDYNTLNDNNGKEYIKYTPNYLTSLLNKQNPIDKCIIDGDTTLLLKHLEKYQIFDIVYDKIQTIASSSDIKKFMHRKELDLVPVKKHINIF